MGLFLRNLLFTIVVPGSVAGWIPLILARRGGAALTPPSSPGHALLLLPVAIGLAIYLWCLWDFAVHGRGTPAPVDPPQVLVSRGLYRYVRNPMYLGIALALTGWWLYFGQRGLFAYLLGFGAAAQAFVLLYEEPHLRTVFGAAYEEYCAGAGRWLPRLGPRR